jgi:hypothetical protein
MTETLDLSAVLELAGKVPSHTLIMAMGKDITIFETHDGPRVQVVGFAHGQLADGAQVMALRIGDTLHKTEDTDPTTFWVTTPEGT